MNLIGIVAAALAVLFATAAAAQYPNRPIKVVVGFPPGGAPDLSARVVSQKLSEIFGQPVLVENRPGANANIAGDLVAKAPPDGYTLLLGPDTLITINPHLYSRMSFRHAQGSGRRSTSLVASQLILTVNPSVPATDACPNSSRTRAAPARRSPTLRSAAAATTISPWRCSSSAPASRSSTSPTRAARRRRSPPLRARFRCMFGGTSTLPQIKSGKLRALA